MCATRSPVSPLAAQEATFLDIMMEFHENDVVKNGVLTFHEFKQFTQKLECACTARRAARRVPTRRVVAG